MTIYLRRAIFVLVFLPLVLTAQMSHDGERTAIRNWSAPLYWQPTTPAMGTDTAVTAEPVISSIPLDFVAMTPCRVVDTRSGGGFMGAFGPPSLSAGATRAFPILSSTTCSIPAIARAYSFEITVVPPGPLAYVAAFPTGISSPVAALTVESPQGRMASNAGVIPAGTNGSIEIYATNSTDGCATRRGQIVRRDGAPSSRQTGGCGGSSEAQ